MKHIKMAAGLAHVDYGHIADLVAEADAAGVDYIHSDAADMHDLKNMQLMGGTPDYRRNSSVYQKRYRMSYLYKRLRQTVY